MSEQYTWYVDIILKSGEKLEGLYRGPENESKNVSELLFAGSHDDIVGIADRSDSRHVLFRRGEVAAMTIYI